MKSKLLSSISKSYSLSLTLTRAYSSNMPNYDATQVKLLDEPCILVDTNDREVGTDTKKNCHLLSNIGKGMLHRAFSVFLFDENKRLLLQQRATTKITYPDHWTNACCSHPLYTDQERQGVRGIQLAAVRRLNYELGIDLSSLNPESLQFLTRIHYTADNVPHDGIFGEHEIDYVLFISGKFELKPNTNEVKAIKYVSVDELKKIIDSGDSNLLLLTPWFKLIADKYLFNWWQNLDDLEVVKDHANIHKFL